MKKILIGIVAFLSLAYIAIGWFLSGMVLAVDYKDTATQISDLNELWIMPYDDVIAEIGQPEKFQLESFDGVNIVGEYFQNTDTIDCGVVISHGHTSGKTAMLKYADLFWDCGCDVVIYDHRAHGESDNDAMPTAGIKESKDHIAVTEWLKSKTGLKNEQIGWAGASWGGATVLIAGAEESTMAFILADAPYQDWYTAVYERGKRMYGLAIDLFSPIAFAFINSRADIDYREASPMLAAKNITEPVFLIHSQGDASTSSQQSVNISKNLNEKSTFIHTDWGADHVKDINTRPEEYRKLFYDFLAKNQIPFGLCGKVDTMTLN